MAHVRYFSVLTVGYVCKYSVFSVGLYRNDLAVHYHVLKLVRSKLGVV